MGLSYWLFYHLDFDKRCLFGLGLESFTLLSSTKVGLESEMPECLYLVSRYSARDEGPERTAISVEVIKIARDCQSSDFQSCAVLADPAGPRTNPFPVCPLTACRLLLPSGSWEDRRGIDEGSVALSCMKRVPSHTEPSPRFLGREK